jgi:hypothetical protein
MLNTEIEKTCKERRLRISSGRKPAGLSYKEMSTEGFLKTYEVATNYGLLLQK